MPKEVSDLSFIEIEVRITKGENLEYKLKGNAQSVLEGLEDLIRSWHGLEERKK